MRIKHLLIFFALNLLTVKVFSQAEVDKAFSFAEKQTTQMLKEVDSIKTDAGNAAQVSPRALNADGKLVMVQSKDWCSGFFPGELWFLYEYSKNKTWMDLARKYTANIEVEKTNGVTHDMGFKIYNSVGNGYRLTKDPHYKDVIIEAAKTLSTRFNPVVGSIKSWDNRSQWKFPVIIDNMLNLELLFEATRLTGDSTYYKIAVTHANTAMKNHFRANYSSYHVVDYDPETGRVLHKQTHQGFADESAWARGQAWGLYGYTMCYRETHNKAYLQQAENIARFIFNNPNMPADLVPYWDYNDPAIPNAPRDVSAAAVAASALYELSTYSKNGKNYRSTADKIINTLSTNYRAKEGDSKGFLLLHSTGHKPGGTEIDVPIIYADYYYLEALLRKQHLYKGQPAVNRF
ncbi:glycoside hydrolase family 88 protein [Mucilaginibacter pocheonensis]|uniref:Glycosyl Hydrolase Family 88 n=1 Tax=Mucilaginibacter pocheonensis TaxID=398050 RepID=A0ABU1T845_9SPHI|nr:glycoside hydrolase family 88 protein [Mucilaginibacter pocheonensis]MDR6941464.1 hypothetical protein [Mucilaginibacter pocheonensis]